MGEWVIGTTIGGRKGGSIPPFPTKNQGAISFTTLQPGSGKVWCVFDRTSNPRKWSVNLYYRPTSYF